MNKLIQLIPVSEYDRIPIKAIETLLTAHASKPIPEFDDEPWDMSPSERLSFEVYPRKRDEFEQYAKKVQAQHPNYYGEFTLKTTLLDFSQCTEHQLDRALDNQDPLILYNVVPSKFAQYLDASGVGKLIARWWQILPPNIQGCDLAISDLKCLQERGIKFYFLIPQFLPTQKNVDWKSIFSDIHQNSIDFISSTGKNIQVFPLIEIDRLKYTRKDGVIVESIASACCRTTPEMLEDLQQIMSIFLEIKCSEKLELYTQAHSGFRKPEHSGQTYPSDQIKFTQALDKTLAGYHHIHEQCQVFQFMGILDAFSEPEFRLVMDKYIDDGAIDIVLDLLDIDFVDSSGLGALVQVVKKVQSLEGTVQVVVSSSIARTINLVQLQQFFSLRSSVAEAISSLA
jgi:anti-anti-sigma factor